MRIISGTARGRKLAGFDGAAIRPTSDRVREALFSKLVSRLGGFGKRSILDLFAGTGALGLEALSRGAERAVLVDRSVEAIGLIKRNADATGLAGRIQLVQAEALQALGRLQEAFDLIFLDPPYRDRQIEELLQTIVDNDRLKPDGLVCVETAQETPLPDSTAGLTLIDRRRYGSTAISLYAHGEPDA